MKLTIGIAIFLVSLSAWSQNPYPGTVVLPTQYSYPLLIKRLKTAISKNGMGIVARASATLGAKSLGVEIPGNMVVMVFNPKFAIRMLEASVPAGFEAPIRIYITEQANSTATLTYRTPSSLFAPYKSAELDKLARELDVIFDKIIHQAAGK